MLNFNADDWLLTLNAVAPIVYLSLSLIIFARLTYSLETSAKGFPVRSLTAPPKPGKPDKDSKQTYLVRLKSPIKCATSTAKPTREEIIRINQEGMEKFKTELSTWAKENTLPGEQPPLQIVGEMPALNMIAVQCSADIKEKLEKLEAIADITVNRGNLAPI